MNLLCLFGSALGWSLMAAWEHMPARWLCDYGQPPPVRAENVHKSVRIWKKIFCAAGFGCYTVLSGWGADAESSVRTIFADTKTALSFASMLLAVWLLGLVLLADKNYQIIPDQLVVLLVLVGVLRASAAGNVAERLTAGFFVRRCFFFWEARQACLHIGGPGLFAASEWETSSCSLQSAYSLAFRTGFPYWRRLL